MSFEEEIFKKYIPDPDAMKRYGFKRAENGTWQYRTPIMSGRFLSVTEVSGKGEVSIAVYDSDQTEYSLIHVESADGEFVGRVRQCCVLLLEDIRSHCFTEKRYISAQTGRIAAAVKSMFRETTDDPWNDQYPGYGVFRNAENRKWYALLMNVDGTKVGRPKGAVEILNVKADPERIRLLLTHSGYHSAYHMNRVHWISVLLDDTVPDGEIMDLIAASRAMTEHRKK